jgi:hypothetical protein
MAGDCVHHSSGVSTTPWALPGQGLPDDSAQGEDLRACKTSEGV